MKLKQTRQLSQTRRLAEAVLGGKPQRLKQLDSVLKAVSLPEKVVVVELPWYPDGGYHQLRIVRIVGDRIHFANPPRDPAYAPVTQLGRGLPRKLERDGTESARLSDFQRLFEGAKCEALVF